MSEPASQPSQPESQIKRHFPVEPIETTTRSNRATANKEENDATPTRRKFAVEPVETTMRSNRAPKTSDKIGNDDTKRRFMPVVEETSTRSNRKHASSQSAAGVDSKKLKEEDSKQSSTSSSANGSGTRRFAPQLIETATRSRKSGDAGPDLRQHSYKTDTSPSDVHDLPRHMRPSARLDHSSSASEEPAAPGFDLVASGLISRFSSAALSKRQNSRRTPVRKSSIIVPRLQSMGSILEHEESAVPSLSTSATAASPAEEYKHLSRIRETCDDRFSGYLTKLTVEAAEKAAAEKALRAQAEQAYPNEKTHEPVDHFAVDRASTSSDYGSEGSFAVGLLPHEMLDKNDLLLHPPRRESAAGWDVTEVRQHRETLEEQCRRSRQPEYRAQSPSHEPWRNPFDTTEIKGTTLGEKLTEIKKMQLAARPPMAGRDLLFPFTTSPQQTRIDPTQHPMALTVHEHPPEETTGLWSPSGFTLSPEQLSPKARAAGPLSSIACGASPSSPNMRATSPTGSDGLWGGFCVSSRSDEAETPTRNLQSGIMTPAVGISSTPSRFSRHELPTVLSRPASILGLDEMLAHEAAIEREYPDSLVTQLYNYLSLGYPAIGYDYDEELSKISKMSIEDIRRDDDRRNARGHVGAPEGAGSSEDEVQECGRWIALRLYLREWARQQPFMKGQQSEHDHGVVVVPRRGSWGL